MWLKISRIALKFHSHLGSNPAEASAKSSIGIIMFTLKLAA